MDYYTKKSEPPQKEIDYKFIHKRFGSLNKFEKELILQISRKCFNTNIFGYNEKTIIGIYYFKKEIIGLCSLLLNPILLNIVTNINGYAILDMNGGFIYNLCVLPNYRNTGIGTFILLNMLNLSKKIGLKYVHTHVHKVNSKSIRLFNKFNFITMSVLQDNNNDIVNIMMKWLN